MQFFAPRVGASPLPFHLPSINCYAVDVGIPEYGERESMMHVLLLTQPFHPDVVATAQHLWDLARHLEARGHRVSVIASRRFYGSDRGHEKNFEKIGKIEIHRVGGRGVGQRS